MTTGPERNLAAEVRAVEEGHHARLMADGHYRIPSDVDDGLWYAVTFHCPPYGGPIWFSCDPVNNHGVYVEANHRHRTAEPGVTCCKHAALVARRLERDNPLVRWDGGLWVCDPDPDWEPPQGDDIFAGL